MTQQMDLVDPVAPMEEPESSPQIAGRSPLRIAFDRLRKDPVALVSAAVVLFFFLIAIFAGVIAGLFNVNTDTTSACSLLNCNAASSSYGLPKTGPPENGFTMDHPFGLAPKSGHDNLAYWLFGARNSLIIALLSTVFSTVLGIILGLIAGYTGGIVDRTIGFVTDLFLSIPFLLAALSLAPIIADRFLTDPEGASKAQFIALIVILSVFGWMPLARLLRGEVLSLREREYVDAARQIGMPPGKILVKEILPNLVAPIVVFISLSLPAFVTAEAGLSFLGIGLTGMPSWGQTINNATNYWESYPLYLWEPLIGIVALVVALNLLGDAIRDALDPRTRR